MSIIPFVTMAPELVLLILDMARLIKVLGRTGIEFVLVVIGFRRELTRLTMLSGAGLFILGGEYGLPEEDRLISCTGSMKEQVTRRGASGGLVGL